MSSTVDCRDGGEWDLVISPKKRLLGINLKELWAYRDLYRMYVKRDIITVYKQTILGPLWFVVQPLLTTIMYMFLFGGLAGISTDGMPQPLFYMAGILLWNYFQSVFNENSTLFVKNSNVFGKVYFPRLVVPLSIVTSNLVKLAIQILLFAAIYAYYCFDGAAMRPNWTLFLFPLLLLLLALHAMGWGLIVSALTAKYRDLTLLMTFGIQLFMYATPVVYPISAAPERFKGILMLNPLTSIFESFRYSVMGCGTFDFAGLLYSFVFMLVVMLFAVMVFNRVERNFMDTV